MGTNYSVHPDASQLSAFALGRLELAEVDAVESHLASCDTCCDALRQIKEDTFVGLVRESPPANAGEMATLPPAGQQAPSDQTESDAAEQPFDLPSGLAEHSANLDNSCRRKRDRHAGVLQCS